MLRSLIGVVLVGLLVGVNDVRAADPVDVDVAVETSDAFDLDTLERRARSRLEQVLASQAVVEEVVSFALDGDEIAGVLRESSRRVPSIRQLRATISEHERELGQARLMRVRLLEQRREASTAEARAAIQIDIDTLAVQIARIDALIELEQELLAESLALSASIDRQLLWTKSVAAVGPASWPVVRSGGASLLSPSRWGDLISSAALAVQVSWPSVLLGGVLIALLIAGRPRFKRVITDAADGVGRVATDTFGLTLKVAVASAGLAAARPAIIGAVGLVLLDARGFASNVGAALLSIAVLDLLLSSVRELCRDGGLADVHFDWDARARTGLRRELGWLQAILLPVAFVVSLCEASGEEDLQAGIGRLAFMVGGVVFAIFLARSFHPGKGIIAEIMPRAGWAWRLRRVWYGLLVGVPAALTVAAAAGYFYSAIAIQRRFEQTGLIVLLGLVVYGLVRRALLIARRRLALQQARQKLAARREERLEQQRAEGVVGSDASSTGGDAVPELNVDEVDLSVASAQTLSLIRICIFAAVLLPLWQVWRGIVPALGVLSEVTLISQTLDAEGVEVVPAVTLWSVILAGSVMGLTILAAKNLPAALELAILQHLPIDAGIRYTAVTLTRYVVIAVGLVYVSNLIGIRWERAQWIVAALGVGLGFGLQEIVANFVSGLIILFERPVRVGDTVTVGGVEGTVSRLQIRATTITDWDNKEVIVPNKSFITEQVINWTLSNATTRLLLRVGVAYGSDVTLTRQAVMTAVKSVPAVTEEPAPSVLFVGFGDSSLDFEVRAFVDALPKRLPTINALHTAIEQELAQAGIVIPFPQRDLHLRSSDIGEPNVGDDVSKS
ncbi:MAG: mechanosensitive ion channel domain-containing protein [Planctomycetota bacterium]